MSIGQSFATEPTDEEINAYIHGEVVVKNKEVVIIIKKNEEK